MSYHRNLACPVLDFIIESRKLKNDADLCRLLSLAPPVISKIRHKRVAVSDTVILRIHEKLGMPVAEIRALLPRE